MLEEIHNGYTGLTLKQGSARVSEYKEACTGVSKACTQNMLTPIGLCER